MRYIPVIITQLATLVSAVFFLFCSIYFVSNRTLGIWTLYGGLAFGLLAGFLYWQNDTWKSQNTNKKNYEKQYNKDTIHTQPPVIQPFLDIKNNPKLIKPKFSEQIENFSFSLGERGITVGYKKEVLEKKHMSNLFVFSNYRPVELYIEGGQLYADVKIYGGSGLPPIEIKKNKLSNKPSDWDFNSNETALEIVDNKQTPIYQFFYKTPSHIVMNGIFPFPGGLILANENGATINPTLPTNFSLKRIFKYPSWKYPGEYEKQ